MLTAYRRLLLFYPSEHREQFGQEMVEVFGEAQAENQNNGVIAQGAFYVREMAGLLKGAVREHFRVVLGARAGLSLYTRRFTMRDGFRFPKTTAVLMTIILAGLMLAIKRGEDIANSLPHVNPQIGPIEPMHLVLLPPIALMFAGFDALGVIGWGILFALRRSGVHRLDEISAERK
jgi:hypothetical protein